MIRSEHAHVHEQREARSTSLVPSAHRLYLSLFSLCHQYFEACYQFLTSIHNWTQAYPTLSPLHWRKQYLRGLFVSCVVKNELYNIDLMHPDPRRIAAGERKGKKDATEANGAAAASSAASASASTPGSRPPRSESPPRPGRALGPLYPSAPGYDDRRSRHAGYAAMILSQTLSHLESNAIFYPSHEPLKNAAIFLMYALIDWWDKDEHVTAVVPANAEGDASASASAADSKNGATSYFSFVFDKRKKDIAGYLADKLRTLEPHADDLLKAGFPLRA